MDPKMAQYNIIKGLHCIGKAQTRVCLFIISTLIKVWMCLKVQTKI